jgi:hypothetical protein
MLKVALLGRPCLNLQVDRSTRMQGLTKSCLFSRVISLSSTADSPPFYQDGVEEIAASKDLLNVSIDPDTPLWVAESKFEADIFRV